MGGEGNAGKWWPTVPKRGNRGGEDWNKVGTGEGNVGNREREMWDA